MSVFHVMILVLTSALVTQGCDIQSCIRKMTERYPMATNAFSYHGFQLTDMCSLLKDAENCATMKLRACSSQYRVVWKVFQSTVQYTCSEESKEILSEPHSCTHAVSFVSELKICNATLQAKIQSIHFSGGSTLQLCSAMKDFSSCAMGARQSHCDKSLTDWYGGYLDAAFRPLINCKFNAGGTHHVPEVTHPVYTSLSIFFQPTTKYPYIHHWKATYGSNGSKVNKYSPVVFVFAMIISVFNMK